MRVRLESFGGVVAMERPPMLALVDRKMMRRFGYDGREVWRGREDVGLFSGPIEVHLSVTGVCSNGCRHCYADARPLAVAEPSFEEMKRRVDTLARMGTLHVALGGGEPLAVEWIFDLAEHVRRRGMVPNVTTSGAPVTEDVAGRCRVFGQVNVSMDGIGDRYGVHRGRDGFAAADRALRLLRGRTRRVGLNCVVSRRNFDHLEEVLLYARGARLNEVELLRYKPAGRAATGEYLDLRLTTEQGRAFFPHVFEWTRRYRIRIKMDCSFVPFLCWHAPERAKLNDFLVQGCAAGNYLMAVKPDGRATGCSFWEGAEGALDDVAARWSEPESFGLFRGWTRKSHSPVAGPPEPCRSCAYLEICRGGCRAVAQFLTGDPQSPDPECPRVVQHVAGEREAAAGS